jgi:very-short-patch-repair endonuclease
LKGEKRKNNPPPWSSPARGEEEHFEIKKGNSFPPGGGRLGWGGKKNTKQRHLRKNPTDAERVLWRHLRLRQIEGHKFRRQVPLENYIADFVCFEKRLIIELDGVQHAEQTDKDAKRDAWMEANGFNVLRFWNHQVLREIEPVLETIRLKLHSPPTSILPRKGGGR